MLSANHSKPRYSFTDFPLCVSTHISFSFPRSSQVKKPQTIFLTPVMYLKLSPQFLTQLLSKEIGSLLIAIENHLIFLDFSKPFNVSDYPLLNNSPVLTCQLSQYLLFFFFLKKPILLVSFMSPHCSPRKVGTHKGQSLDL